VVDGAEGGTGAAPLEFTNHVGAPLREALLLSLAGLLARIADGTLVPPAKLAFPKIPAVDVPTTPHRARGSGAGTRSRSGCANASTRTGS